jgi:dihydrofolate synthase/folylpolyglutamate synthase
MFPLRNQPMTPREALDAIDALEKFGIHLGLGRIRACLNALGDPQDAYPTIHVGGTNGKGSASVLIASVLAAAGHRTGLYTSPPLEFFGERIQVDRVQLADVAVPELLEAVLGAARDRPEAQGLTQFEVITAMAFLHFLWAKVDAAVIEVGLGGRLDSTNVIRPEVSVITNVGLEHLAHLGPTVEHVAREKAGIVKSGVPLVTAAEGAALAVLEEVARSCGSPCYVWGRDFEVAVRKNGEHGFTGRRWKLDGLQVGLRGSFQRFNVAVALGALETLEEKGWRIGEPAVRRGLAEARWPGRFEVFGSGPRVLLDGAHNPHASKVLAQVLAAELTYSRLWLVLGILGDKDARSILADLVPLAHRITVTRSSSARAMSPEEIRTVAERLSGVPLDAAPTVAAALDRALEQADREDLICVTGSLTTVGEARGRLRELGWVR